MNDRSRTLTSEAASRREERHEGVFIALLVLPALLGLAFTVFGCFRLFSAPSGSMIPNLPVGTHVLVSRLSYGFTAHTFDWFDLPTAERWPKGEIRRGDIVVFRKPNDRGVHFVKRVIGLGGDRVQLKSGRLFLNGEVVSRDDAGQIREPWEGKGMVPAYYETLPGSAQYKIIEAEGDNGHFDTTEEFVVPANALFMMGDNRDNSVDSRDQSAHGVGFVPIDFVIGKVVWQSAGPAGPQPPPTR